MLLLGENFTKNSNLIFLTMRGDLIATSVTADLLLNVYISTNMLPPHEIPVCAKRLYGSSVSYSIKHLKCM